VYREVVVDGNEQYARHGKGALSGLRISMISKVKETANIDSSRSDRTIVIGCWGKKRCLTMRLVCFLRSLQNHQLQYRRLARLLREGGPTTLISGMFHHRCSS
jgi:hypothetical protein